MRLRTGLAASLPIIVAATSFAAAGTASAAASPHHAVRPGHAARLVAEGVAPSSAVTAGAHPSVSSRSAQADPQQMFTATTLAGPSLIYGQLSTTPGKGRALVVRDLQTNAVSTLIDFSASNCEIEPKISPDHTQVLYANIKDGDCSGVNGATISVYSLATHTSRTVASMATTFYPELPNWSPDGATILFTLETDDAGGGFLGSDLWTVAADGLTDPVQVPGAGVDAWDGVYSPSGTQIAFSPNPNNYLALMDTAGANVVPLSATGSHSTFSPEWPAWSPDGSQIAYAYDRAIGVPNTYRHAIAVIDAGGTNDHVLASTGAASQASFTATWSDDATQLFYDTRTYDTNGDYNNNTELDVTGPTGARSSHLVTDPGSLAYEPSYVGPDPLLPTASTYTPAGPTRVLVRTPLGAGGVTDVQVAGGTTGVPANATAVTINLTGVNASASTYLQAYPTPASGSTFPLFSNVNLTPGLTAAVAAQVTVGAAGKIRIRNAVGTTGVIVDLSGYFTPDTTHNGYVALPAPNRLMDTSIPAGNAQDLTVVGGSTGAPAGATAVVLNLTGAIPGATTYLSAYPTAAVPGVRPALVPGPAPAPAPAFSNLNLTAGVTRANLVTVPIGPGGAISVYNSRGTIRTIVDVQGYYVTGSGQDYYPLAPTRVLDTRNGTNTPHGSTAPVGAAASFDLPLAGSTATSSGMVRLPADAAAAVLNVTAVKPTVSTYLTVFATPSDSSRPFASNLNPAKNAVVSNLVIAAVGGSGQSVRVFNAVGACPVLADIAGYYAPPPP